LDYGAHRRRLRPQPAHNIDRALRVGRAFHVHAHEIVHRRSPLDDPRENLFAQLRANVQAKLRQLHRNIRIQFFGGNFFENRHARIAGKTRFGLIGHAFAQIIEAHLAAQTIHRSGRFHGLVQRLAGNEPASHRTRHAVCGYPACQARACSHLEEDCSDHGIARFVCGPAWAVEILLLLAL
jgi:hypothetical protein